MKEAIAFLLSISPISELRGGLIYAASVGLKPIKAFLICVFANLLVAPIMFFFLSTLHKYLLNIKTYKIVFNKTIKRFDKKVKSYEKRHKLLGYLALTLFTAIPLPYTGAYTASLIAWLLGLDRTKSIIAISLGVFIAGIIVSLIAYSFVSLF